MPSATNDLALPQRLCETSFGSFAWDQMNENTQTGNLTELLSKVRSVLHDLPSDYGEQLVFLLRFRRVIHDEIAKALRPGLNTWAKNFKIADEADTNKFVQYVNNDLHMLGLALSVPPNAEPAILGIRKLTETPQLCLIPRDARTSENWTPVDLTANALVPTSDLNPEIRARASAIAPQVRSR